VDASAITSGVRLCSALAVVDKSFRLFSTTPDQPVGMADGSVVSHNRAQIKKRAIGGHENRTVYFY
jgi:hypothetical protein